MAKKKNKFRLEHDLKTPSSFFATIIGQEPNNKPYVVIGDDVQQFFIPDKDLERFAVNILKALNKYHRPDPRLNFRLKRK